MDKIDRLMISMLFAFTMALILIQSYEIKQEIKQEIKG
ncbi:MAG: hypothetical protein RI930_212 [Pseudomonadota bacterium]|jgi:hypothetical protein